MDIGNLGKGLDGEKRFGESRLRRQLWDEAVVGGEIVLAYLVADVVGKVQDELEDLDGALLEETGRNRAMGPFLARDTAHRET